MANHQKDAKGNKVRFIRKNGKVIPIRAKGGGADNRTKKKGVPKKALRGKKKTTGPKVGVTASRKGGRFKVTETFRDKDFGTLTVTNEDLRESQAFSKKKKRRGQAKLAGGLGLSVFSALKKKPVGRLFGIVAGAAFALSGALQTSSSGRSERRSKQAADKLEAKGRKVLRGRKKR